MKLFRFFSHNLIIILVGALLFLPQWSHVHLFDWDEINFAESAREMLVTGDYFRVQINYQTFWEKPPLFIWMQALSMTLFGVNEFAARFPNVIAGIVTLLVLFHTGRRLYSADFGYFWLLAYVGSFLPHFYFKSGIIDPFFNLFIFLSIIQLARLSSVSKRQKEGRAKDAVLAGLFAGLAILTKGPAAFLIIGLCILFYLIIRKSFIVFSLKELLLFGFVALMVSFAWFGVEFIKNGPFFLQEFIVYQIRLLTTPDAGHGGPFYYHIIVLLLGVFPASILAFNGFRRQYSDNFRQKQFKRWMLVAFFVVLVLFSLVKTKIVHYSSFCYLPLTFLAAYALYKVKFNRTSFPGILKGSMVVIGILISALLIAFPLFLKNLNYFRPLLQDKIRDPFALANLEAQVNWSGWEILPGVTLLVGVLYFLSFSSKNLITAAIVLLVSGTLTIQLAMPLIVPKIERYSQGAAIDFLKSLRGKDVYVDVLGYKSYAHLFYTQKPIITNKKSLDKGWLLTGDIDKPVYIVTKIGKEQELKELPEFEEIGRKNGFVFYRRLP